MRNENKLEKNDLNSIIYIDEKFCLYIKRKIIFPEKENFSLQNEISSQ